MTLRNVEQRYRRSPACWWRAAVGRAATLVSMGGATRSFVDRSVEVLSEATRDYDRGEKLVAYQAIPTLRELLLVEQDAVAVERIHRTAAGTWLREGGGAAGCGRASRIGRRPAAARRGLPRGVRRGPDKGPKLTR